MLPVFSLLFWAFIVGSSVLLFPVALLIWAVTAPFDRRLRVQHLFTCFWASLYSWCNPFWRVKVEGHEHIVPGVTYVMVANHQSFLDILTSSGSSGTSNGCRRPRCSASRASDGTWRSTAT